MHRPPKSTTTRRARTTRKRFPTSWSRRRRNLRDKFAAIGGNIPEIGVTPSTDWPTKFEEQIQKKHGDEPKDDGWVWTYIVEIINRSKDALPKLDNARKVVVKAQGLRDQTTGRKTINAAAAVVKKAIDNGYISASEAQAALNATNRAAMGYPLTDQERALAMRIGQGSKGVPKAVWYAIPAAAAAIVVGLAV